MTHSSRYWSYSIYILAALAKVLRLVRHLGQQTADSLCSQLEIGRDRLCTATAQAATCEVRWKSTRCCRVCWGFYPRELPSPPFSFPSLHPCLSFLSNSESLPLKQLTRSLLNLWNDQQLNHYSHCRYNAFIPYWGTQHSLNTADDGYRRNHHTSLQHLESTRTVTSTNLVINWKKQSMSQS